MPDRRDRVIAPVRLVDVDLGLPAVAIEDAAGCANMQALVWRDGAPVGWITVPVIDGRCGAESVARALEPLGNNAGPASEAAPDRWPTVTVAVCTRDRTDDLRRCLDALACSDYPGLDILVVDNAPGADTTEALVRSRGGSVRYVREGRPGLDWARNRAIREARGEILAFTDDDVIVDRGWVRALAAAFARDPSVSVVTGLVVPAELETDAQVLFERYRSFARGFARRRITPPRTGGVARQCGAAGDFGTGANMAFRHNLFDRIGPFDPALDVGTPARGGGDLEIFFRALKEGNVLLYEPRALVRHRHRRDLAGLSRQMSDHGVGFTSYLVRMAMMYPEERAAAARIAAWWLSKTLFRIARPKAPPAAAMRRLGWAELCGCLAGLSRYPRSRRAAQRIGEARPA